MGLILDLRSGLTFAIQFVHIAIQLKERMYCCTWVVRMFFNECGAKHQQEDLGDGDKTKDRR